MIYKNGYLALSLVGKAKSMVMVPFNADITNNSRKGLIDSFNLYKKGIGKVNGLDIEEYMAGELYKITDGKIGNGVLESLKYSAMGVADLTLMTYKDNIEHFIETYTIDSDELKSLDEKDHRYSYNMGRKTYEDKDYRQLIKMKIELSIYILMYSTYCGSKTHVNDFDRLMSENKIGNKGIKHKGAYERLSEFIKGHVEVKPSTLVDIGEYLNVIPLADNIYNILTVQACVKLVFSKPEKVINSIFSVVRTTRNPLVEIYSKAVTSESDVETSWVSSFTQASELALGEVGELQAYTNLEWLKSYFGIKDTEQHLIDESLAVTDAMTITNKYGTYLSLPKHVGNIITPVVICFMPMSGIKYLDSASMANVIAITYVLMRRINKRFAYLLHSVAGVDAPEHLSKFKDTQQTSNDLPMVGMVANPSKEDIINASKELYYDATGVNMIKEMLSEMSKSIYAYSVIGGYVIDEYVELKLDYLEFLLNINKI